MNTSTETTEPAADKAEAGSLSDRRDSGRIFYGQKITIMLRDSDSPSQSLSDYRRIEGWSRNVSGSGINFLCLENLHRQIILVTKDESTQDIAVLEVVRAKELIQGLWENGAAVRRVLTVAELEAELCR